MDVVLEPISPELVLVCPELREPALALLPDFNRFLVAARARPVPAPAGVPLWQVVTGAVGDVASVLTPALTLLLAVLVMTGVLTFIADAVASR